MTQQMTCEISFILFMEFFWVFVLLPAHVERLGVSRMHDFFYLPKKVDTIKNLLKKL